MSNKEKSLVRRRTHDELIDALKTQIKLLQSHARQYDNGLEESSISMATILRTLLWEDSLLSKIHIRKKMDFLNSAYPYEETNLLTQHGLLALHLSADGGEYLPHKNNGYNKPCKYTKWMNEIVLCDGKRNLFRRKNLIDIVANKDGGAHLDIEIPEDYYNLKENNSMKWMQMSSGSEKPLDNDVVYASIRQMTYEILMSLYLFNQGWFSEEYF